MKLFVACLLVISPFAAYPQDHGFAFGKVGYNDLNMNHYAKDTSAVAVVLNEFGEAYMDSQRGGNLIFEYHVKIKILKVEGIKKGEFVIPLYALADDKESTRTIKASCFNIENGSMKEYKLDPKKIFTVRIDEFNQEKRFAIPNVKVGSVIEIFYILDSPFIYNFHDWEFQSDIPKLKSEYWAYVVGNYRFNITVRGSLKLDKNVAEIARGCYTYKFSTADCTLYKWAMSDVPAFREEEYMTAAANFISKIKFELAEVRHTDGKIDRFTKKWKDVEEELSLSPKFGVPLQRGESIVDKYIEDSIFSVQDSLARARKIYEAVSRWFRWDEKFGKYTEQGIQEAFDKKVGNSGDINLSLIAALRRGGLNAEPVLLSTRNNGVVTERHPVLSEFNYVIAKVNIGNRTYLLDATENDLPFGMIPLRCLNGKGRVFSKTESYWYDLKTADAAQHVTKMDAKLNESGVLSGTLATSYFGYEAYEKRNDISAKGGTNKYIDEVKAALGDIEITGFSIENLEDISKPVIVTLNIKKQPDQDLGEGQILFNPFIMSKWTENPFKSNERLYPVDFAAPMEDTFIFSLEYPNSFLPVEVPESVSIVLPNNGGKYTYDVKTMGNKLSLNNSLIISRTVFPAEEYRVLKDMFGQMVTAQQTDYYFKKK